MAYPDRGRPPVPHKQRLTPGSPGLKIAAVLARLLVATVLVLVCAGASGAEDVGSALDDYSVTTWTETDGLPAASIRALEQGAEGDLWIGTDTGLVRFDGVNFVPFEKLDQGRLPSGAVGALLRARDGGLWVGLNGRKSIARLRQGAMALFGESEGLPDGQITSLHQDAGGAIWAGSQAGLYRFDGKSWVRVPLPGDDGGGWVLAIREDVPGRLWVVARQTVFRRLHEGAPFEVVEHLGVSSNVWQSLSHDRNGRMWVTDFERGVRPVDGTLPPSLGALHGWGVQILHDSRGAMWVATRGQGLWRVPEQMASKAPRVFTTRDGLVNDAVHTVLEDRDGNIWVGTPAGLQRLSPHHVKPVRDLGVVRVLEATPDGSVWVGTSDGLARVSSSGRLIDPEVGGLPGAVVLTLHTSRDGALWVATERGVARYAGGRFSTIDFGEPGMQRVFAIATTKAGDLWMRDYLFRLYHWRAGRMQPLTEVPDAHRRNVFSLYDDRDGHVWIGGSRGRLGVRRADGSFAEYNLPIGAITKLLQDSDGAMWAGGNEGLTRITSRGAETITRDQGFAGSVKSIVEDQAGDLWVGVGTGIIRVEKAEFSRAAAVSGSGFHYRFLNVADGLAGMPIAEGTNTGVRTVDGHLWFATSGGATIVNPAQVGPPPRMPPVRIESITGDGQRFDPATRTFEPARGSHLHVRFTALALTDPTRVRFRYRLVDYDHGWVDAGSSREASFLNLAPGRYRFVVEASNGDGIWQGGATSEFGIAPMFYQTTWFSVLCVGLVGLMVAGAWQYRVQQVRRQFAMVLAERIRMSREIHDTLLQGLAGLALEVDDLSHNLEGAKPGARERVLAMRRRVETYLREARLSIFDLRSPDLATKDLPQALREVGQRIIGDRPVQFDVSVKGAPQRCPPRVKEQLLLIGQEAVNNAVRHGRPTRVSLELSCDQERTRLRISDDGLGFDPDELVEATGHYGLRGMRERAQQVRGTVAIQSVPGGGTLVEAVVPTA